MANLLTWQEIEKELGQAFTPEQAASLKKVLDRVQQIERERATDAYDLKQGLAVLAAAQARTEARLEELAAAQARTEARLERLEAAVEQLAAAQARTEARLEELAAAQARTEIHVADLRGWRLESQYRERALAYFGPLLRHLRVLSLQELEETLEACLSPEQWEDLMQLDLLLTGQPRHHPEAPPVWLAVEVSATVDPHDVERAQRRAAALRQAGCRAIPTVAGEQIAPEAQEAIRAGHLLVLQDGYRLFWEEALAAALSA